MTTFLNSLNSPAIETYSPPSNATTCKNTKLLQKKRCILDYLATKVFQKDNEIKFDICFTHYLPLIIVREKHHFFHLFEYILPDYFPLSLTCDQVFLLSRKECLIAVDMFLVPTNCPSVS